MSDKAIEIENIAAVKHVTIPYPDGGGIVVLKADNGKGKSTTLAAIESAVTGNGSLSVRDGALKGTVSAFGVTITVGKNTRRKGELSVTSLDGKLSIGELIDPGRKEPEAADARRIKALLALVGAEADPSLFHELFGGKQQFEGLSPRNRKALAEHARSRGAVVITAMATDDDSLTAEVL